MNFFSDNSQDQSMFLCMSYNIRFGHFSTKKWSWHFRSPRISQLISNYHPHVVGLQEVLKFQLDYLSHHLQNYAVVGVGRDDGKEKGEFVPIFVRKDSASILSWGNFWLSNTPSVPGSSHWGNKLPRICTWAKLHSRTTSLIINIYNVHLDHQSQESRKKSVILISKHIQEHCNDEPVILMGDFNVTERNEIIGYIKGTKSLIVNDKQNHINNPLLDTYKHVEKVRFGGTHNLFIGFHFGPKIDYIFASKSFKVLQSEIIHPDLTSCVSDHFPLLSKLSLQNLTTTNDFTKANSLNKAKLYLKAF